MFWWDCEGDLCPVAAHSRSKADVLRGIVNDRLSTAAREILAVVERTVAEYEEEAAGFRQEIDRQKQALEVLLQSQVKTETADVCPDEQQLHPVGVKEEEEEEEAGGGKNSGQDGHVWNNQQLCPEIEHVPVETLVQEEENEGAGGKENPKQDQRVWSKQRVNQLHPESQRVPVTTPEKIVEEEHGGRESPEEDAHMSDGEFENLGLIPYIEEDDDDYEEGEELPPLRASQKQKNKRPRPPPRSGTRTSLRLRMNDPKEFIQLSLCILADPHITEVSPRELRACPTQEVSCPVGLPEEDFLDLLRFTFPQISNKPFDLFSTDDGLLRSTDGSMTLLPLHVETLTAEEIQRKLKDTDQSVYIRLRGEVESSNTAVSSRPVPTNTTKMRFVAQRQTRKGADNGQSFIDLRFLIPDVSDIEVMSSKQVRVVRCPLGLQEEDFLSQLRSLFPQLAGDTAFELFHTNSKRDLIPLNATKLTPEEIWKSMSAVGSGSTGYVRIKRKTSPDEDGCIRLNTILIMDPHITICSKKVLKSCQSQVVQCPLGLQEEDFLSQLRSTFPQLGGDVPFELFSMRDNGTLISLDVTRRTPEEIRRFIVSSGNINTFLCIQLTTEDGAGLSTSKNKYLPFKIRLLEDPNITCLLQMRSHMAASPSVVESSRSEPSVGEEPIPCRTDESSPVEDSVVVTGQSDRGESQPSTPLRMSRRKSTLAVLKSSKKRRKSAGNPTPSSSTQNHVPDAAPDDHDTTTTDTGTLHTLQQTPTESSDQQLIRPNPKDTFCTFKNYCYVCKEPQSKIARHLKTHENTEPDIAAAFMLPKKSAERKRLLEKLRNKGNYEHNHDVMDSQSGPLKLKRRPKQLNCKLNAQTYMHCVYCKGMFSHKMLQRHMKKCPSNTGSDSKETRRNEVLGLSGSAASTFSQAISPGLWKILGNMREGVISSAVQNDFLILQLAQSLYDKHGTNQTKYDYIRQKVREMGRLLLSLRKKHSLLSFEDALKPDHFYKVVEAVKDIAGYDEENRTYNAPSLALNLGLSLRKTGDIILRRAMAAEDDGAIQAAERFKRLCSSEWPELISHTALATLTKSRFKKPSIVPFTQDVQRLNHFLEKRSADAYNNLKKHESSRTYADLARVTLAQIVTFNRRRAEASRMTLESFRKRDQSHLHEDADVGLSPFEKKMFKHFSGVQSMGKRGRKVTVLLNPELVGAINLLVDKRDVCHVDKDNPFLFARPKRSATSYYRGQDCISGFASLCGVKNLKYLKSAQLRKQVATMSQILSLEDKELHQLATFLGRNIRVHRDYYRLPKATKEIAKIAKLLLAMETESVASFQGKPLDDIDVEGELEKTQDVNVAEISEGEEDADPHLGERLSSLKTFKCRADLDVLGFKRWLINKFPPRLKNRPYELVKCNTWSKLAPLSVDEETPERIYRDLRSTTLYVRFKELYVFKNEKKRKRGADLVARLLRRSAAENLAQQEDEISSDGDNDSNVKKQQQQEEGENWDDKMVQTVQTMETIKIEKNGRDVTSDTMETEVDKDTRRVAGMSCKVCNILYRKKSLLTKHAMSHVDDPWSMCGVCGIRLRSAETLRTHLLRHQTIHVCDKCGKVFVTVDGLRKHAMSHTGERPHACPICWKTFTLESVMRAHVRFHDEHKAIKCKVCHKAFTTKSQLKSHSAVHSSIRPYTCTVCGKGLKSLHSFTAHMTSHSRSGTVDKTCKVCRRKFYSLAYLSSHMEIHKM